MKIRFVQILPILVLTAAVLVSGLVSPVCAASAPTAKVKQVMDSAMRIQAQPDLQGVEHRPERMKQVRKLISDNFLSEDMGRETVKEFWGNLSASQRSEFITLFSVLFQDSYTRLVLNFLQQENVEYRKETIEGKTARVETAIQRPNEHVDVNYTLWEKKGTWYIGDVEIDGVSIVSKYKSSFVKVVKAGSFNDLLNKLRLQKRVVDDD